MVSPERPIDAANVALIVGHGQAEAAAGVEEGAVYGVQATDPAILANVGGAIGEAPAQEERQALVLLYRWLRPTPVAASMACTGVSARYSSSASMRACSEHLRHNRAGRAHEKAARRGVTAAPLLLRGAALAQPSERRCCMNWSNSALSRASRSFWRKSRNSRCSSSSRLSVSAR